MKAFLNIVQNNVRQYSMTCALLFIMLLFQLLTDGILLQPLNITNIILQNSYILILAIGMVMIIITGHIDLSVGSVAAFIGALSAILMIELNVHPVLAVLICLIAGALVGAWQGFWVAYVQIPAFIVTLAGMLIFRGITLIMLEGQSIASYPPSFQQLSSGFLPDLFNGDSIHLFSMFLGIVLTAVLIAIQIKGRKKQLHHDLPVASPAWFAVKLVAIAAVILVFTYVLASYRGIPNILILLVALIAFYAFVTKRTVFGRHIYAVGGNEKAAALSGIKTKRVTFAVFVNMGILAALSGLIFAARLNAATPRAGNLFELDAIAAAFIGGASAYGGVGTIIGAVVGGLVMGVMNNGMSILGLGIDWQQAIKGLVLLAAVAFDVVNKRRG
ncbi:multiple monosaccharide ABC transporter permease [Shouchella clausii]|jgi:putative multiple sugar transport system permease protein|uniref:multiple monosaccharide ABC transporter permease n=1 Tax=Shouchella clausii TaxID=79880 RepID=UPI000BA4F2A4|nr:multiple monosaccharide ABC transporter permease [Shouchella clausii]PAD92767.1 ABC transporter permease [Shouchella clausii]